MCRRIYELVNEHVPFRTAGALILLRRIRIPDKSHKLARDPIFTRSPSLTTKPRVFALSARVRFRDHCRRRRRPRRRRTVSTVTRRMHVAGGLATTAFGLSTCPKQQRFVLVSDGDGVKGWSRLRSKTGTIDHRLATERQFSSQSSTVCFQSS